jgi:hypothetical protein
MPLPNILANLFNSTPAPAPAAAPASGTAPAAGKSAVAPAAGAAPAAGTIENPGAGDVKAGTIPANQQQDGKAASGTPSPLDDFSDLWDTGGNKGGPKKFSLNVDPKAISEAAKKIDFRKVVSPELAAKALAGDAEAFTSIINTVGQAGFANSFIANSRFMEKNFQDFEAALLERIPNEIKRHNLSDTSFSDNPALNHKAAAPLLRAIQQQFAEKHPDATTAQLQEMSKKYFATFLQEVAGKSGDGTQDANSQDSQSRRGKKQPVQVDWDKYMLGAGQDE